jgi:hypothetical protein
MSTFKLRSLATLGLLIAAAAPSALGAPPDSRRAPDKGVHFKSPSGNIHCRMNYEGVGCLLRENTWPRLKPRPADCDVDWFPTDIAMYGGGQTGRWVVNIGGCRGDIGPLCYGACLTLGYGRSVKSSIKRKGVVLGIRCTSATNGVTCMRLGPKRGVRGFRIAREGYLIFR